jgi:hypothetical protein
MVRFLCGANYAGLGIDDMQVNGNLSIAPEKPCIYKKRRTDDGLTKKSVMRISGYYGANT